MVRPIKGNNGKAARRSVVRKIATAVGLCVATVIFVEVTGLGGPASRRNRRMQLRPKNVDSSSGSDNLSEDGMREEGTKYIVPTTEQEKIDLILSASVHLVSVRAPRQARNGEKGSYEGVEGTFCRLDWEKHKNDPSSFPMFRDLVSNSKHCTTEETFSVDLKKVVDLARHVDENIQMKARDTPRALHPAGFVFHESRCGSTLVANALAAMDPMKNRVYSESAPPIAALKLCGIDGELCSKETAAALFRDVVYMMGRTDNPVEENVFFKIQSMGTKYIDTFLRAYPETPWIYVFRDPVQVMMSQLKYGPQRANCVHQLSDVPKSAHEHLASMGRKLNSLIPEEKCALHLSMLCESAVSALSMTKHGHAVNYKDLLVSLTEKIIPYHFSIPITDAARQRITEISTKYSKGRGDKSKQWKEDSEKKDAEASEEIRKASTMFLDKSYTALEEFVINP